MKHLPLLRSLTKDDWSQVSKIYGEGIATGIATFETRIPTWEEWDLKHIRSCRIVAEINQQVAGFAVLSQVSKREVYKGVAEVSVYIQKAFRGFRIGEKLLNQLIKESLDHGFWTLQAGIFSENKASIQLHLKCGFRIVGIRENIGYLNGQWYDNHFLERRQKLIS